MGPQKSTPASGGKNWWTEQSRGYVYRVLIAAGGVLIFYGVATSEEVAIWLGVATTLLNIMPAANTTVSK